MGVDGEHRQLVNVVDERRAAFRAGQRAILPFVPGSAAWSMIAQVPLRKRIALGFLMTDFTFMTFIRNAQEQRLPDKHVDS